MYSTTVIQIKDQYDDNMRDYFSHYKPLKTGGTTDLVPINLLHQC